MPEIIELDDDPNHAFEIVETLQSTDTVPYQRPGLDLSCTEIDTTSSSSRFKPMTCFELKDRPNEFFLLIQTSRNLATETRSFKGLRLKRDFTFGLYGPNGYFHSKPNEVVLTATIDKDDKRPWFIQGAVSLKQAQLGKIRQLCLTDEKFPHHSYLEHPCWSRRQDNDSIDSPLAMEGPLTCRHMVLSYWTLARSRAEKAKKRSPYWTLREEQISWLVSSYKQSHNSNAFPWLCTPSQGDPSSLRSQLLKHFNRSARSWVFFDLCCGFGGASLGAQWAGYEVLSGVDINEPALKNYHNIIGVEPYKADVREFVTMFPMFRELLGRTPNMLFFLHMSFTCKSFSGANRDGDPESDHNRENTALLSLAPEAIKLLNPLIVTGEQTSGLTERHRPYFDMFMYSLKVECGYNVRWAIKSFADWGCPQDRKRLLFIAAKPDIPLPTFPPAICGPSSADGVPYRSMSDALDEVELDSPNHNPIFYNPPKTGNTCDPTKPFKTLLCSGADYHDGTRRLTVAETLAMQTFPPNLSLQGTMRDILMQIGNAVPPRPWSIIMEHIRKELEEYLDKLENEPVVLDDEQSHGNDAEDPMIIDLVSDDESHGHDDVDVMELD